MNGVVLHGYVGIGESARGNRGHQSFFINGRYMRSNVLSSALEEGTRERVMIGKYPICVLHLTMPYDQVDVNVHPNKLEVRFQREAAVAEAVSTLVRDALRDRDALERPVEMLLTPEKPAVTPVEITKNSLIRPDSIETNKQTQTLEAKVPALPIQTPVYIPRACHSPFRCPGQTYSVKHRGLWSGIHRRPLCRLPSFSPLPKASLRLNPGRNRFQLCHRKKKATEAVGRSFSDLYPGGICGSFAPD